MEHVAVWVILNIGSVAADALENVCSWVAVDDDIKQRRSGCQAHDTVLGSTAEIQAGDNNEDLGNKINVNANKAYQTEIVGHL